MRAAQRSKILDGHRSEGYARQRVLSLDPAELRAEGGSDADRTAACCEGRPFIMRRSRPDPVWILTYPDPGSALTHTKGIEL